MESGVSARALQTALPVHLPVAPALCRPGSDATCQSSDRRRASTKTFARTGTAQLPATNPCGPPAAHVTRCWPGPHSIAHRPSPRALPQAAVAPWPHRVAPARALLRSRCAALRCASLPDLRYGATGVWLPSLALTGCEAQHHARPQSDDLFGPPPRADDARSHPRRRRAWRCKSV